MTDKNVTKMNIKVKRHPEGMIDLRIVPFSTVAGKTIKKLCRIPLDHYVLVVDMGEQGEPEDKQLKVVNEND